MALDYSNSFPSLERERERERERFLRSNLYELCLLLATERLLHNRSKCSDSFQQFQKLWISSLALKRDALSQFIYLLWAGVYALHNEKFAKIRLQTLTFAVLLLDLYYIDTDGPTISFTESGKITSRYQISLSGHYNLPHSLIQTNYCEASQSQLPMTPVKQFINMSSAWLSSLEPDLWDLGFSLELLALLGYYARTILRTKLVQISNTYSCLCINLFVEIYVNTWSSRGGRGLVGFTYVMD